MDKFVVGLGVGKYVLIQFENDAPMVLTREEALRLASQIRLTCVKIPKTERKVNG